MTVDIKVEKLLPELIEAVGVPKRLSLEGATEIPVDFNYQWINYNVDAINRGVFKPEFVEKSIEILPEAVHLYEDSVQRISLFTLASYFKNKNRRNFVVQKDFFNKFKNIDLDDLKFSDLPSSSSGFVQLPTCIEDADKTKFDSFFFYIGKEASFLDKSWVNFARSPSYEASDEVISITYFGKDKTTNKFIMLIPENRNLKIKDIVVGLTKSCRMTLDAPTSEEITEYESHLSQMMNLLLYVHSGDPDVREHCNKLQMRSPGSTKVAKKDKIFSTERVFLVGYNWLKERQKYADSWEVECHWRKQRYGEKLGKIKLVWISSYDKTWKK